TDWFAITFDNTIPSFITAADVSSHEVSIASIEIFIVQKNVSTLLFVYICKNSVKYQFTNVHIENFQKNNSPVYLFYCGIYGDSTYYFWHAQRFVYTNKSY